jgi:hypothetical protein
MTGFTIVTPHVRDIGWRLIIVIFVDGGGSSRSIIGVLAQPLLLISKKLWLVLGVEKLFKQAAVSGSAFDRSLGWLEWVFMTEAPNLHR